MSSVIQGKSSYKTRYEFTWSTEEQFKQTMRKQQTNSECGPFYRLTSLISTHTQLQKTFLAQVGKLEYGSDIR